MSKITMHLQPNGAFTGFIGDDPTFISTKHPAYAELRKAHEDGDAEAFYKIFMAHVMDFKTCEKYEIEDEIEIKEESIEYRGRTITDTDLISVIKNYNTCCDALKRFVDNLFLNPRWDSVKQLARFLKHNNLPLTEDGCFLGYKGVQANYFDIHSGTIHNGIGKTIVMPRANVTFDPEAACSAGLHVGTHHYANDWRGDDGILLIVKVNPAHVVSVPFDCDSEKLRTSQYTVIAVGDNSLDNATIYSVDGTELKTKTYLADLRETDYRRKRSNCTASNSYYNGVYADEEGECDDDAERYICDNCNWQIDKDEADNTFDEMTYCPKCGNELDVV